MARQGQTGRPLPLREFTGTFYVNPRQNPDFAWAFASRVMLALAYAFLTTYQAYYLLDKIGSAEAVHGRRITVSTRVPVLLSPSQLRTGVFEHGAGRWEWRGAPLTGAQPPLLRYLLWTLVRIPTATGHEGS